MKRLLGSFFGKLLFDESVLGSIDMLFNFEDFK